MQISCQHTHSHVFVKVTCFDFCRCFQLKLWLYLWESMRLWQRNQHSWSSLAVGAKILHSSDVRDEIWQYVFFFTKNRICRPSSVMLRYHMTVTVAVKSLVLFLGEFLKIRANSLCGLGIGQCVSTIFCVKLPFENSCESWKFLRANSRKALSALWSFTFG